MSETEICDNGLYRKWENETKDSYKIQRKQDCLSVEGEAPANSKQNTDTFLLDLHLEPMTLIYELDLEILKTYLHSRNEFPR